MKKIKKIFFILLIVFAGFLFLNMPVITKQGIDGTVYKIKIPLYVKISGFIYRDFQYKFFTEQITRGSINQRANIEDVFDWTVQNIKKRPEDFPSIDDHIWYIIVRGYGSADQAADVFTTLASYTGCESFWEKIDLPGTDHFLILSFVKIDGNWEVFDVYNKKAFIDLRSAKSVSSYGVPYSKYVDSMDKTTFDSCLRRPDKQKCLGRVVYEFKKKFFGQKLPGD